MSDLGDVAYGYGVNISQGLANGMLANIGSVSSAASQVAAASVDTIHDNTGIGSPSKITTAFGRYISEGLANGINDKLRMVKEAALGLSNAAIGLVTPNRINSSPYNLAVAGAAYGSESYAAAPAYDNRPIVLQMDGQTVGSITAPYSRSAINKIDKYESMRRGSR